jgi:hypothetical protein
VGKVEKLHNNVFFPKATIAFRSGTLYNKESYAMRLDDLPQEGQLVQWGGRRI